jgi:hypothetical protein
MHTDSALSGIRIYVHPVTVFVFKDVYLQCSNCNELEVNRAVILMLQQR